MMKKTKEIYSQPTTKLLVVQFEQGLLQGSVRSFSNQGTETIGYDVDEDL